MKTQNKKLIFKKDSIIELSTDEANNIQGGTWVTLLPMTYITFTMLNR